MLSLDELPPAPQLDRSYSKKELLARQGGVQKRVGEPEPELEATEAGPEGWVHFGHGNEVTSVQLSDDGGDSTPTTFERIQDGSRVTLSTNSSTTTVSHPSPPPSAKLRVESEPYDPIDVGDEGAVSENGQQDRRDGRVDAVFKLHSSRRMKPTSTGRGVSIPSQRRWCRYVNLLFTNQAPPSDLAPPPESSRLRLLSVTMILHPPSGWQKPLASMVVGGQGTGQGKAWASVARYDDSYVSELRERLGGGENVGGEVTAGGVGGEGAHDTAKMFRSCGKMVPGEMGASLRESLPADHASSVVHHLVPSTPTLILERSREFRLKFHLGSLPMGWTWLIPAFHLPEPRSLGQPNPRKHVLHIPKSQLDFPLGPGAAMKLVLVELEEVPRGDRVRTASLLSDEEERREGVSDDAREENVDE
ncbi:hypothetical protein P7C73_g6619, partial [Tremellales sp. Uapishka_1]